MDGSKLISASITVFVLLLKNETVSIITFLIRKALCLVKGLYAKCYCIFSLDGMRCHEVCNRLFGI